MSFHRLEFEENYNRWTQNVLNFFAYDIQAEEGEEIKNFVSSIIPKLNFTKTEHYDRIISLSIERYQWALMERIDIDRKMLFAVMGYEPLVKTSKDTKEIGPAIANRVSFILKHFGYKQKEVKKDFLKAYNYRNEITHGGFLKQSDFEKMINLFPRIVDYLRMILIIYLVGYNSKSTFFSDLKNAQKRKSNKLRENLEAIYNKFPNCFKKTRSTRFFSKSLLDVKKMFEEIEKNKTN